MAITSNIAITYKNATCDVKNGLQEFAETNGLPHGTVYGVFLKGGARTGQFNVANHIMHGGFIDGLARVVVNNKDGYINKTGAFVIPPTFDIAYKFSEGFAKVGFAKASAAKNLRRG